MRIDLKCFFLILGSCLLTLSSCHHPRQINTSFYYWKTVYRQNSTETGYLRHFKVRKLYVRIMDVGLDSGESVPVPVSPVTFSNKLPDSVEIVPVVFLENAMLKSLSEGQLQKLSENIARFVNSKVKQSGKSKFNELQMDCDWTASTRKSYFYLLRQLTYEPETKGKTISATLRLHQLKNRAAIGIPPVNRVMLMCYNMGNLRKYGNQNSIMELSELKKYLGDDLNAYPMAMDVGLPLFSWAVAFRDKQYIGIAKKINFSILIDAAQFLSNGNNMYSAKTDLPALGLQRGDEVRWEAIKINDLQASTAYIAHYLKPGGLNVVYFHLDEAIVKNYTYEELQNTVNLLH